MTEFDELSFDEAVEYVINNKSSLLYTFVPTFGVKKKIEGGIIYTILYAPYDDNESDIDNVMISEVGGRFNDDFGSEDSFPINCVPKHAKDQKYRVTSAEPPYYLYGYNHIITLKRLLGLSEADALNEFPCPDCDQIVFKTLKPGKCDNCKNT